jgi:hypothetical protein
MYYNGGFVVVNSEVVGSAPGKKRQLRQLPWLTADQQLAQKFPRGKFRG